MASDWIPMRMDLAEDPAVIYISGTLGLDADCIVGKLHRLWSWANRQTQNGHARNVTAKWVDEYLRVAGFAQALSEAGWLEISEAGVTVPKFAEWNSQSAKIRILAAKRKRKEREEGVTQVSRTQRDKSVTKEEKRIEEENTRKPPCDDDGFARFWDAWPNKVDKLVAAKVWEKLRPSPELRATIMAGLEKQKGSAGWLEENGKFIPGPARWLRGARWEDVVKPHAKPQGQIDENEVLRRSAEWEARARERESGQLDETDQLFSEPEEV